MVKPSDIQITRVAVRGFRSLENVTVSLSPVTVLVGPNGSGKSAFVDALAFLRQALYQSPQDAFRGRGGIEEVITRTGTKPNCISLEVGLESRTSTPFQGSYRVKFKAIDERTRFSLEEERCEFTMGPESDRTSGQFVIEGGEWKESIPGAKPRLAENRLGLPLMSSTAEFAPIYDALTSMCFYNIIPDNLKAMQAPEDGGRLAPDGSNAAVILRRLRQTDETLYRTVVKAVSQIVPSIRAITAEKRGNKLTLTFDESFKEKPPVSFDALSMSDGTLRVLGILLAIYQADAPSLVALEEPETAIHPGAAATLVEAIQEAARRTQILITTHSPDLLSRFDVDALRAVERRDGVSVIRPIAQSQREAIEHRLFTAGEIHRMEGLPLPFYRSIILSEVIR